MKRILFLLIGLLTIQGYSQNTDPIINQQSAPNRGQRYLGAFVIDSTLIIPVRGRTPLYTNIQTPYKGRIQVNESTSQFEYHNGTDWVTLSGKVDVVNTLSELEDYNGEATTLIWNDTLRGGLFNYRSGAFALTVDNGVVFEAVSGYWERQFNKEDGLNVLWYGADPSFTADNADLLEEIVVNYSYLTNGRIHFPYGTYKASEAIGGIGSHGNSVYLKNPLIITNEEGATIKVDTTLTSELPMLFGFETDGNNVDLGTMRFDGSGIANRVVYFRDINSAKPESDFVTYDRIRVLNTFMGDDSQENNCTGITFYGKTKQLNIENCEVTDVHGIAAKPTIGVSWGGTVVNDRYPKKVRIKNNIVTRVYNNDTITHINQDAFNGGMPLSVYKKGDIIIEGNTVVDARGRVFKVQQPNVQIKNNLIETTAGFQMPSDHKSAAIEVQYADGIVSQNKFILNSTAGYHYFNLIEFTERSSDTLMHRATAEDNIAYIPNGVLKNFVNIYDDDDSQRSASVNINRNIVDGAVNNAIRIFNPPSLPGPRQINASFNEFRQVDSLFISNRDDKDIYLFLQKNKVHVAPVNVADNWDAAKSVFIGNEGITGASDTYARTSEVPTIDATPVDGNVTHGISSDWAYGFNVSNTAAITALLPSIGYGTTAAANDNWNTITVSGLYRNTTSGATGIPVAFSNMGLYHIQIMPNPGQAAQFAFSTNTNKMYFRRSNSSGSWQAWQEMMTTGDAQTITGIKTSTVVQKGIAGVAADDFVIKGQMDTALAAKQETLVSGTNIKTVGGTSLLGSGNVTEVQNSMTASTTLAPSVTAVSTAITNLEIYKLRPVNTVLSNTDANFTGSVEYNQFVTHTGNTAALEDILPPNKYHSYAL